MARSVPLARRNLLAEPRRLVASAVGIGLAVMLILLADGLWAGVEDRVSAYQDNVGADLYVAQPGTRNFLGAVSSIGVDTVGELRADPDVEWAEPVRGFYSVVELHGRKEATYIVGSRPGAPGGPWELHEGRAPERDDEIAIGQVTANRHGLKLGDEIDIMGRRFTVIGTSSDSFMVSFVFMTHAATDELLSAAGTTSFVLVGTDDPAAVRTRVERTGLAVLDRDELASNDRELMARAFSVPLEVMRGVAFAVGVLVIALTAYTAIAERRREYGIIKAIGARRRHLLQLALGQTLVIAALGVVAGALLFSATKTYIGWARPQYVILATPGTVARAVGAAAVMGVLAAIVPARRLATLEPAAAYRGG